MIGSTDALVRVLCGPASARISRNSVYARYHPLYFCIFLYCTRLTAASTPPKSSGNYQFAVAKEWVSRHSRTQFHLTERHGEARSRIIPHFPAHFRRHGRFLGAVFGCEAVAFQANAPQLGHYPVFDFANGPSPEGLVGTHFIRLGVTL